MKSDATVMSRRAMLGSSFAAVAVVVMPKPVFILDESAHAAIDPATRVEPLRGFDREMIERLSNRHIMRMPRPPLAAPGAQDAPGSEAAEQPRQPWYQGNDDLLRILSGRHLRRGGLTPFD